MVPRLHLKPRSSGNSTVKIRIFLVNMTKQWRAVINAQWSRRDKSALLAEAN